MDNKHPEIKLMNSYLPTHFKNILIRWFYTFLPLNDKNILKNDLTLHYYIVREKVKMSFELNVGGLCNNKVFEISI